jgi:hypothetical protein
MPRLELIREWEQDGFALKLWDTLWDTYRTDEYHKSILAYEFSDNGRVIFEGEDFACSPMHAIDSDECIAGLLAFLSLRPGDTDREYFDSYTPEQMAWCEDRAEELGMIQIELEESARAAQD